MIKAVVIACLFAMAASRPQTSYDPSKYTIMYDGPEGRHVQMGEPGKAVSGYYTARSDDGLMEYKTMYEADEKGFRVRGDHLPDAKPAQFRSDGSSAYIFNYDEGKQSHYQMGEPGKSVQGSYMYYDPEGRARRVNYVADDQGYRVTEADEGVSIKAVDPVPETKPVAAAAASIPEPKPEVAKLPETEKAPEPANLPVVQTFDFALKSADKPSLATTSSDSAVKVAPAPAPTVLIVAPAPAPAKVETKTDIIRTSPYYGLPILAYTQPQFHPFPYHYSNGLAAHAVASRWGK